MIGFWTVSHRPRLGSSRSMTKLMAAGGSDSDCGRFSSGSGCVLMLRSCSAAPTGPRRREPRSLTPWGHSRRAGSSVFREPLKGRHMTSTRTGTRPEPKMDPPMQGGSDKLGLDDVPRALPGLADLRCPCGARSRKHAQHQKLRLPDAPPASLGFDADRLKRIDAAIARAIERRQVPGAVVLVGRRGKSPTPERPAAGPSSPARADDPRHGLRHGLAHQAGRDGDLGDDPDRARQDPADGSARSPPPRVRQTARMRSRSSNCSGIARG